VEGQAAIEILADDFTHAFTKGDLDDPTWVRRYPQDQP
jgi:hypothetical protein